MPFVRVGRAGRHPGRHRRPSRSRAVWMRRAPRHVVPARGGVGCHCLRLRSRRSPRRSGHVLFRVFVCNGSPCEQHAFLLQRQRWRGGRQRLHQRHQFCAASCRAVRGRFYTACTSVLSRIGHAVQRLRKLHTVCATAQRHVLHCVAAGRRFCVRNFLADSGTDQRANSCSDARSNEEADCLSDSSTNDSHANRSTNALNNANNDCDNVTADHVVRNGILCAPRRVYYR